MKFTRLTCAAVVAASCTLTLHAGPGIPRTADGRPDLQGIWTNGTATPLERPAEFADREFFTAEEADAFERTALPRLLETLAPADRTGADLNYTYMEYFRVLENRRTSLIVDPPNGRLPDLVPQARERNAARRPPSSDDPETRTLDDRCLVSLPRGGANAVPPIVPNPFAANYYQIVQTPDYVIIAAELLHDARIIRLNGHHLPSGVRPWLGDSVGRWEGDTLVVDTTNFNDRTRWRGSTPGMRVTERFTRTDAKTIDYRFTVEDPDTWSRPWTAEIPFKATDQRMFEYACHEGNYALGNLLRGARAEEKLKAMTP
jgi:hypothetical protein